MKNVLIVDDEKDILDILQRILLKLGYRTVLSTSGESAMVHYARENYDIVLMDIYMPKANGLEVVREMKRMRPDQKVIMVTAIGERAAKEHALTEDVEIDEVLPKPFSYDDVRSVLCRVLNNQIQRINQCELYKK